MWSLWYESDVNSIDDCSILFSAAERNVDYSLGHNIFELYNVLAQIQLTTSKAKRDIV